VGFAEEGGEGGAAANDYSWKQSAGVEYDVLQKTRTYRALNHGPQCQPRAAGGAAVVCLDTDLYDANDGEENADKPSPKEGHDAKLLRTRHLQIPNQLDGESHDCALLADEPLPHMATTHS
jgi:hypothetical protein